MARPKARTISRPFDARHVAGVGVGVPGVFDVERSFTSSLDNNASDSKPNPSSYSEPMATDPPIPKRANTVAHSISRPTLRLRTSISRLTRSTSNSPENSHRLKGKEQQKEKEMQKEKKPLPPVRPARADSGTAIDLTSVPVNERPLGFQEIIAVKSFAERMALYKRTRDYWATADHGLDEWVEKARVAQTPMFKV